jgi:hypothetical protein
MRLIQLTLFSISDKGSDTPEFLKDVQLLRDIARTHKAVFRSDCNILASFGLEPSGTLERRGDTR